MALTAGNAYPAATRRLRLGIVGGGRGALVGKWHEAGFRLSNRWELVAGALSSDPDVARASGRDWMLAEDRAYTDYAAMARAEAARPDGIEAVTIVTPNHTHRSIAEAFLEAGIDVICDKPITNSIEDANALVRAQQTTGLVFAVTYPSAFHAMVRQAREMVRSRYCCRSNLPSRTTVRNESCCSRPRGAVLLSLPAVASICAHNFSSGPAPICSGGTLSATSAAASAQRPALNASIHCPAIRSAVCAAVFVVVTSIITAAAANARAKRAARARTRTRTSEKLFGMAPTTMVLPPMRC
jgi:hypothetical protein